MKVEEKHIPERGKMKAGGTTKRRTGVQDGSSQHVLNAPTFASDLNLLVDAERWFY